MSRPPLTLSVLPGDLYFTRNSGFISRAIRDCEQVKGEPYPDCSHVGGYVTPGYWDTADCVEALRTVERHRFGPQYEGSGCDVMIARPLNLTPDQIKLIVSAAWATVGQKYGYGKILAHLIDARVFGGRNVARRLCFANRWPICSWVWAHAFLAAGLDFGCSYRVARPSDMSLFVRRNPDKYAIIQEFVTV